MIDKSSLFEVAKALEGIPVLGTLSDSPAARAGIRYGDILLEVNGQRTRTMLDYINAKALRSDGMSIVVFRTGCETILNLTYSETPRTPDAPPILAELIALRIAPGSFDGESGSGSGAAG